MNKVTTQIPDKKGKLVTIRAYVDDETLAILRTLSLEERHQYIVDEHFGVHLNNRQETEKHISMDSFVDAGRDLVDQSFDVAANFDKKILYSKLHNAISTLSPYKQKIIYLYFFENKTMEQVAEDLGVQKPAISKQISRILEKLRALL